MENKKKNVVAIIPARGGSKGVPGKNVKFLGEKPLIAYTIEVAKRCPLINRVIVSTDDEKIAEVAIKFGAEVPFIRPAELAQDMTSTEPVLKHAVEWLEENENYKTDIVVFFQLTDLPRIKGLVEKVVSKILEDDSLDSVFVATPTRKNYWRKTEDGWQRLANDIMPYGPRQKKEALYKEDTGLACATRVKFIKEGRRLGDKVDIIINESEFSIDINDPIDFWLAERYWEKGIDLNKYEP